LGVRNTNTKITNMVSLRDLLIFVNMKVENSLDIVVWFAVKSNLSKFRPRSLVGVIGKLGELGSVSRQICELV